LAEAATPGERRGMNETLDKIEHVSEEVAERAGQAPGRTVSLARGLSTKLLMLTVLFVMVAEVLIFLPSIANYRLRWLEERLATAAAVGIVLVAERCLKACSRTVQDDVLIALGAKAVAVRDDGASQLLWSIAEMPPQVDDHIDLANTMAPITAMSDALYTASFSAANRMLARLRPRRRERHRIRADPRPIRRSAQRDARSTPATWRFSPWSYR
jgi:tetrahydromethanopterin S-methyltransferase subunit G